MVLFFTTKRRREMKRLIIIPLLLISTNYFAQDKAIVKTEVVSNQANHLMINIANNSQMRLKMMQMMIEQTVGKQDEMRLLVNQILSNSDMKIMIRKVLFQESNNANNSMGKSGMMKKYIIMKKTGIQEKPEIRK
jgi:hypothetical protein